METLLLVCLLVGLIAAWVYFRNRLYEVEARITGLEWREGQRAAPPPMDATPPVREPAPAPAFVPPPVHEPAPALVPAQLPPTRAELASRPALAPAAAL